MTHTNWCRALSCTSFDKVKGHYVCSLKGPDEILMFWNVHHRECPWKNYICKSTIVPLMLILCFHVTVTLSCWLLCCNVEMCPDVDSCALILTAVPLYWQLCSHLNRCVMFPSVPCWQLCSHVNWCILILIAVPFMFSSVLMLTAVSLY